MTDIHVALITPWQRQGGIATYSERFADALEESGVKVTPVPVESSNSGNPFEFVDLISKIPGSADVIHVQFEAGLFGKLGMSGVGAPAFLLALNRLNRPVVTTLHEVHGTHPHRGILGDYLLRTRDFVIERLALETSDATVVHTRHAQSILRDRHGDNHRIERMLHPADSDADLLPKEEAKKELDIEGPVILTFGFVEEKKRYQDVIRVLPDLPNATYVIAGGFRDGEGQDVADECRNLAAELGVENRIRFTGYVDSEDVPVIFSAADVVVLPYERVSQSGVVNDALAYERPVVASSLPAFEELRDEFGCLLTYEDSSELESALDTAIYDTTERDRLQTAAAAYIDEIHWDSFAAKTRRLYDDLKSTKYSSPVVNNPN